ncbi:MAG: PD-(D/E)XK nuclease family protein, partial [Simkaniaceae bacterium]|nr:PD-(D/E)XK nuclease family protein [Simkaniaceae bacterium]
ACDLIPPKSVSLVFPEKMTLSFTALAKTQEGEKKEAPDDVLPLGAMTGIIFHAILEKAIDRGIYLDREKLQAYVEHEVHGTHLDGHKKEVFELIDTAFSTPLGLFCLRDVDPSQMLTEGAFCYEKNAQVEIKGFADLVFCHNGKYHLVDWKTNYLGQQREDYAIEKLEREMERHDYFLQSRIYSEAIKKHLNVIETRPYEEIFGSAHYIFLRGLKWNGYGTLSFSPEIATVETL